MTDSNTLKARMQHTRPLSTLQPGQYNPPQGERATWGQPHPGLSQDSAALGSQISSIPSAETLLLMSLKERACPLCRAARKPCCWGAGRSWFYELIHAKLLHCRGIE